MDEGRNKNTNMFNADNNKNVLTEEARLSQEYVDEEKTHRRRNPAVKKTPRVKSEAPTPPAEEKQQEADDEEKPVINNEPLQAATGYLLCFLPYILNKNSPLAIYHAKQGIYVNIMELLTIFIYNVIVTLGVALRSGLIVTIGGIIGDLLIIVIIITAALGIFNAIRGKQTPLPLVGEYDIPQLVKGLFTKEPPKQKARRKPKRDFRDPQ